MQIRVIFALPSLVPPSLGALGSCPSRPPLDPPLGSSAVFLCPEAWAQRTEWSPLAGKYLPYFLYKTFARVKVEDWHHYCIVRDRSYKKLTYIHHCQQKVRNVSLMATRFS